MSANPHILLIDPAVRTPELDSFNHLVGMSPLPLTYHLPAMFGMESLHALSPRALEVIKGIVILGSASSVNERHPWQRDLESWLMPHLKRGIPTFGICYGHQMLASMFGGTIDYVQPDQFKFQGLREVVFQPGPVFGRTKADLRGQLIVSHNEFVRVCPPEMTPMGRSELLENEAMVHKTLPIFSVQSHPEATELLLQHFGIETSQTIAHLGFGWRLLSRFFTFVASKMG